MGFTFLLKPVVMLGVCFRPGADTKQVIDIALFIGSGRRQGSAQEQEDKAEGRHQFEIYGYRT